MHLAKGQLSLLWDFVANNDLFFSLKFILSIVAKLFNSHYARRMHKITKLQMRCFMGLSQFESAQFRITLYIVTEFYWKTRYAEQLDARDSSYVLFGEFS